ncbi:hypothetical protein EGJ34_21365 [Stenotrophomonas sp. 278]|nr:hypothetical protein EGJ34_21365 [Stenotrophomonas sp. 278]
MCRRSGRFGRSGLGDTRLAHTLLGGRVGAAGFGRSDIGQELDSSLRGASARQGRQDVWEKDSGWEYNRKTRHANAAGYADTTTGLRQGASRAGRGHSCGRGPAGQPVARLPG